MGVHFFRSSRPFGRELLTARKNSVCHFRGSRARGVCLRGAQYRVELAARYLTAMTLGS